MKVQCGKYELLDSIFVTQVEGKPIDITLEDPSDKDLYISFAFETNKDEKESLLKFNIESGVKLQIKLINFIGSFGGGNSEAIFIGNFRKKQLFLNYRVFDLLGCENKSLLINFYLLEMEEQNGK